MSSSAVVDPRPAERTPGDERPSRRLFDVAFYIPSVTPLLVPAMQLSPTGGAETQVFLLSRALARRGLRVAVIAAEPAGGHRLPSAVDGVAVITRPPYRSHSPMIGKLREAARIWRTLRRVDAEVVVRRMCGVDVGIVGAYARLARTRFVYSSASVADFSPEQLLPKRRDVRLFEFGVKAATRVVVQTEEQVELCRRRFHTEPLLARSIAETAPPAAGEPSYFVWIGRLIDYKNPMAFVELARSVPEAQFAMVGVPHEANPDAMQLAGEVRDAAASTDNLRLVDPVPRTELSTLFERAVAVVNTAVFEGMPNVMLEAWARGVPALALQQDPDGVIERHGLGGYARRSSEALAQLARELWAGRQDAQAQRERCRRYIEAHHSEDAVVERWLEALAPERD
jgi:glycosyltransferase involved in cell wall biosynthesis